MSNIARSFPWLVLAVASAYLAVMMTPAEDAPGQMQLQEFARLPVVDRGRVKPMDTVARTSLMIVSHRQSFRDDKGKTQPAIKWLLDTMVNNGVFDHHAAEKYQVFRIENDDLLRLLGLEMRPMNWRYSLEEFGSKIPELVKRAEQARDRPAQDKDAFDAQVLELVQHLQLYMELANLHAPYAIPPTSPGQEWQPFDQAFLEAHRSGQDNPNTRAYGKLLLAYAQGKTDDFNRELASYRARLDERMPDQTYKAGLEVFFNHFEPFYHCTLLYIFVFLMACVGWIVFTGPLNRAAFWLTVLTLVVHTWALLTRMYLQGRPPVTNLYSAAVWIAWGCVLLGLFLEKIYGNGVGNVVAAITGSLSMLLAHHLAGSGDTLEMMQAVLDTNFWLATHVTIVTFGYVATVVAGVIGALYVVSGVLTTRLDKELARTLGQMIYGVLCFGTLLSFTGTVLGGIWADQSWGRFWGWDPKENGALLIVIWNALILHARWGGMIKQRGMAVLSIFGIMLTGWSGIGTNQLGVGLHAYGFSNALAMILVGCWGVCAGLLVLGSLPTRWWRSFAAQKQELPSPGKARGRSGAPIMATSR
ncbi:MAG TPA: cytochrome c biogenesis protein CcsA [Gemmataceae bacterium]|nr:cytochrome c biogenesis protein CcsA [Gemmataceae bacterium]